LAERAFDRSAFAARLTTRQLGRTLLARPQVDSTNDVAWDALGEGATDGIVVVAEVQTRGRGREGRAWHTAPGLGLALSIGLFPGCDRRQLGPMPLVAGLALARGLDRLGVRASLKWPNDLLLDGRKLAGVLCEARRLGDGAEAAVIGVGVNVGQSSEDFPAELRDTAASLALAGATLTREAVAAEFLNAFEPLWVELQEGDRSRLLAEWKARADFWGSALTAHAGTRAVTGIARGLDADGALVLELPDGSTTTILAGDLEPAGGPG
jgi:BirA family biotin operon repressor/biotin-[acetyl-CoA-carboxylase] ligase